MEPMRISAKIWKWSRVQLLPAFLKRISVLATTPQGRVAGTVVVALLLTTCTSTPSLLQQVKERGVLRVVTRNSPTTFYFGPRGPTGLEHDLAQLFAKSLGVKLQLYAPPSLSGVLNSIRNGHADMAAAGLTITQLRQQHLRFGPPYQYVSQKVVYRYGEPRPSSPADLVGRNITVMADSSHVSRLAHLKKQHPKLQWTATNTAESAELLAAVAHGNLDYTVADSNEFMLDRRYYPKLRAGFNLESPEPLAWAFRRTGDLSLYQAAIAFFSKIRADGKLAQITARYYGVSDDFDYVGTSIFINDVKTRLPKYENWFKKAAQVTGIDWRLLAAIGYQESHWNPHAVSPTGVRGVMMLTLVTARDLGIKDRINPRQSILGGSEYLSRLKERMPDAVASPDRTWMALAAYNVGIGHLMDARAITRERGGNPNRWIDVRESLPLLTQRKWYSQTRYGYARGEEPLIYVANIRSYYSILTWLTQQQKPMPPMLDLATASSDQP